MMVATPSIQAGRGQRVLSMEDIRAVAPSVFANRPWEGMSEKYKFIPTADVVARMQEEGFQVVRAQQSRCRIEGKGDFTKHMLRFRRVGAPLILNEVFQEVCVVNSHDGASSYQCYLALLRLACLNGMVADMGNLSHYRTTHSGNVGDVIDAAYRVVDDFPQLGEKVQAWQGVGLTDAQQLAYAHAALELRWNAGEAPVEPSRLLTTRRGADAGSTLWLTYQKVQENLSKGGLHYLAANPPTARRSHRHMHTRAVNSVSEDVKLNRALWTLTEKMGELAHA